MPDAAGPFGWRPPYDDAFITLTSAEAVWSGAIPAYPDTPVLAGITSPVHLALVAGLTRISPPLTALWLSQVVGLVLYGSGLWVLARAWQLSRPLTAGAVSIGLLAGFVPFHLFNGLETGLVLAAVTWALALATRQSPWCAVLAGVLPFVRPELGALSVALLAWSVARGGQWQRVVMLACLGAAPWAFWLFWHTGTVLPSTGNIKRAFLGDNCWPPDIRLATLTAALARWLGMLGLVGCGVLGLRSPGLPRFCGVAFAVALVAYAMGLPSHLVAYHHQRYLHGWLPVVILGGISLCHRYPARARWAVPLALGVTTVLLPSTYAMHRTWASAFLPEQDALVEWLRSNVPAHEPLMVIDAGYLAFATPYRLVDAVGLKTPSSAALHLAVTGPSCAARRRDSLSEIASSSHVRYFIGWGEWEVAHHLSDALRAQGWTVAPVRARPDHVSGEWWYPVFHLTPPVDRGPSQANFLP